MKYSLWSGFEANGMVVNTGRDCKSPPTKKAKPDPAADVPSAVASPKLVDTVEAELRVGGVEKIAADSADGIRCFLFF